jgi:hypothetical protein
MTTERSLEARLEALGSGLDDAARRAGDIRVHHARRPGRPSTRGMLTLAAALLLLAGLGALLTRLGGDAGSESETATDLASPTPSSPRPAGTATTTPTTAPLDPLVVEALDAPAPSDGASCMYDPVRNWPSPMAPPPGQTETFRVGHGPNCESGYVRASERAPRLYPVYRTPTSSEQIGWWADAVGWVTPHAAGVARFDVAKLIAARTAIDALPPGYGPDGERLEPPDDRSGD